MSLREPVKQNLQCGHFTTLESVTLLEACRYFVSFFFFFKSTEVEDFAITEKRRLLLPAGTSIDLTPVFVPSECIFDPAAPSVSHTGNGIQH